MAAQEFVTHSAEETIALGKEIAKHLCPPVLVLLRGDLGSGKTTLAKGIVVGLGAAREEDVTSPTFNLVHEFHVSGGTGFSLSDSGSEVVRNAGRLKSVPREGPHLCKVYHVDLYRVESFHDLESLGLEDALAEQAIVIIEWPERFTLRSEWPTVEICLEHAGEDSRQMTLEGLELSL